MINIWYMLGAAPWLIVMITALARLNDIQKSQNSKRWHVRRVGLILTFVVAVIVLAKPFTPETYLIPEGGWLRALVGLAWSMQLMTTPGMPPWHLWIAGYHRAIPEGERWSFGRRIGAEFIGLRDSFRNRSPGDLRSGKDRRQTPPNVGNQV